MSAWACLDSFLALNQNVANKTKKCFKNILDVRKTTFVKEVYFSFIFQYASHFKCTSLLIIDGIYRIAIFNIQHFGLQTYPNDIKSSPPPQFSTNCLLYSHSFFYHELSVQIHKGLVSLELTVKKKNTFVIIKCIFTLPIMFSSLCKYFLLIIRSFLYGLLSFTSCSGQLNYDGIIDL